MKKLLALLLGVAIALIVLEIGCQIYSVMVYRQWSRVKAHPDHFFAPSDAPELGYEHAKGYAVDKNGRVLRINDLGIRDTEDGVPDAARTIAILGDSVVFGVGLSQDETISALLQRRLDPSQTRVKVLNFGVSGYALEELVEFLRRINEHYDVDEIVYILNPNDFCRRFTVTEGSDNGLFRMYHRSWLKSPWMLRKALYRLRKGGRTVSVDFYRWVFARERDAGFRQIERMAEYAAQRDIELGIVLLPAGCAYRDGDYELREMHDEIAAFLERRGIPFLDPVAAFDDDPSRYFNTTDHFHLAGNARMAEILQEWLRERAAAGSADVRDGP